ncbi:MAG: CBS domain-containing protein [Phaeodactylibacter sp.]|nr:CBS domain-containing protein [Phaeodactylibacter sp.]MCB9276176.1 CBS domain-containing protein [Lewinellaceae bacterium]
MEIIVSGLMRPFPVTLHENQSAGYAKSFLERYFLPMLPVVGPQNELMGLVAAGALKDAPAHRPIAEFMERDVITVPEHQGVHIAARIMSNYGTPELIVTNRYKAPVGFITALNLLKLISEPVFASALQQPPTLKSLFGGRLWR